MTYLKIKKYYSGKPILFGLNQMNAPFSVSLTDADVLADANSKKLVTEGMFIVNVGTDTRFLPRTNTTAVTATNSKLVSLAAPSFQFKVNDVLYAKGCYAEVAIEGTVTSGDVYTIAIDGVNYSVTTGSTSAVTEAAAFVTANATALLALGITVTRKGASGTLSFFGTDSSKIDTFSSSGLASLDVRSTEAGYFGDYLLPLGTVESIGAANSSGVRVVTLAGNAAFVLPSGCSVGTKVDAYLGIYPEPLDFTQEPVAHLAPIFGADGVYENNLPYCDKQLKRVFFRLNINKKFYAA